MKFEIRKTKFETNRSYAVGGSDIVFSFPKLPNLPGFKEVRMIRRYRQLDFSAP